MSGDVQPRKRKDKRRKKDDIKIDGEYMAQPLPRNVPEDVVHQPPPVTTPSEDFNMHIHHDHGFGGNMCAKIVFFILFAILAVCLVGLLLEDEPVSQVTSKPEVTIEEPNFLTSYFGWLGDFDDGNGHGEHDDHGEHDGHGDEHDDHGDEHDDHEDEHDEEDEDHGDNEGSHEGDEEDEEHHEESEEVAEAQDDHNVYDDENQQGDVENTEEQTEEDEEEVEEGQEEEEEEEEEADVEEHIRESEENQEDEGEYEEELQDDEHDNEDEDQTNEEETDFNYEEEPMQAFQYIERENSEEVQNVESNEVEQENEVEDDDQIEEQIHSEEYDIPEEENVEIDVPDNQADEEEEIVEHDDEIEDVKAEESNPEENSSMAVKFGVGVALVVVAHFVLIRKWSSGRYLYAVCMLVVSLVYYTHLVKKKEIFKWLHRLLVKSALLRVIAVEPQSLRSHKSVDIENKTSILTQFVQ